MRQNKSAEVALVIDWTPGYVLGWIVLLSISLHMMGFWTVSIGDIYKPKGKQRQVTVHIAEPQPDKKTKKEEEKKKEEPKVKEQKWKARPQVADAAKLAAPKRASFRAYADVAGPSISVDNAVFDKAGFALGDPYIGEVDGTGPVGMGEIGDGGGVAANGDIMPLIRVEPVYPQKAALNGTEGFVTMSFDIDESGAVINASVIEENPRNVFDKAALKALRNWKYKPQMVDGKAVLTRGVKVRLDFKLQK